jgi:hypothetical protein
MIFEVLKFFVGEYSLEEEKECVLRGVKGFLVLIFAKLTSCKNFFLT